MINKMIKWKKGDVLKSIKETVILPLNQRCCLIKITKNNRLLVSFIDKYGSHQELDYGLEFFAPYDKDLKCRKNDI